MKKINYSPKFKSQIAINAIENKENIEEISQKHGINETLIRRWEKMLRTNAHKVFMIENFETQIQPKEHDVL